MFSRVGVGDRLGLRGGELGDRLGLSGGGLFSPPVGDSIVVLFLFFF